MIQHILLNSLLIIGLFTAGYYERRMDGTYSYQILGRLVRRMDDHLPEWMVKPIIGCMPCMASLWGVAYCLLMTDYGVLNMLVHIMATSGLLRIAARIV
jgi:hypothetical protein